MLDKTYFNEKKAVSVNPTTAVTQAMIKVMIPKVECVGTSEARHAAVPPSQHNRIKKLKNPITNCKVPMKQLDERNVQHLFTYSNVVAYN